MILILFNMIIQNKKITDLTTEDFDYVFNKAYPQIPEGARNSRFISYEDKYVLISNLGCIMVIWDDYRIELYSDVIPKFKINLIEITNALLQVGGVTNK